jgi:hypothetical protein
MKTSFLRVTLALRPDQSMIIPKSKIIEIRGDKDFKGNTDKNCEITYETRGNIGIITVLESVEEVFRMLNHD